MTPSLDHKDLFQKTVLKDKQLQQLMITLGGDADEVRVVGGAVRNVLRGVAVSDIDVATVHIPQEVIARASKAGFKTVPTGIEHGTVTVVGDKFKCEVTTLREDVLTDGRHAIVRFGTNWLRDAERRDFTMNALGVDRHGALYDLIAGLDDCLAGKVRFIGDANARIAEDALRSLRFFRFSAHYGRGNLDDTGTLAAHNSLDLLAHLSVERVQQELSKLLSAPDPNQLCIALNAARPILAKFGLSIDQKDISLVQNCQRADWRMRLALLMKEQPEQLMLIVGSLRLSNVDLAYLKAVTAATEAWVASNADDPFAIRRLAFKFGHEIADVAAYLVTRPHSTPDKAYMEMIAPIEAWAVPVFPIKGADLLALGFSSGPELGEELSSLQGNWLDSKFQLSKETMLSSAKDHLQTVKEQTNE